MVWSVGFRIIEAFRDDVTRSNFTEKFMEVSEALMISTTILAISY